MSIAILPFGAAPWIKRITKLDYEFRGTVEQLQKAYVNQHNFVAVEGGQYHDEDEYLFGIFKLVEPEPYVLKLGNEALSFPTMGDVLVTLNKIRGNDGVKLEEARLTSGDESYQFFVSRTDRGKIGVVQNKDPEQYFASMFFEVFTRYLHRTGKILSPHEMKRSEWEAVSMIGSAAYSVYPCLTAEQAKKAIPPFSKRRHKWESMFGSYDVSNLIEDLFFHYCGYSHNGPAYGNDGDINCRHEVHVAYALAQGKPVPEVVLDDYRINRKYASDLSWMEQLLYFPVLRGAMSTPKLRTMTNLLRHEKIELTSVNVEQFLSLVLQLQNDDPSYVEMDNHLYRNGILKDFVIPEVSEKFDPSTLENELAREIRAQLIQDQTERENYLLDEKHAAGGISDREFSYRKQCVDQLKYSIQATGANRFAVAIRDKDVEFLLNTLDTPDTDNASTKRAIQKMVGVKILGLRSKQRHDAIFKVCGLGKNEQTVIEVDLDKKRQMRDLQRKKDAVLKTMEGCTVTSLKFGTISVKEYVEKAVEAGFNRISRQSKGVSYTYWLCNPSTQQGLSIRKVDGSFDYASDILQLQKMF